MEQLLEVDNLDEALSGSLEIIISELDSEAGAIWYLDPKTDRLSPVFHVGPITGALKMKPNHRLPGFDESWRQSDTMVPVKTAQNPIGEAAEDFVSADQCKPGIWYKMPLESKDHLAFMGVGEENEMYGAFIYSVVTRMLNLPTVDGNDVHLK